MIGLTHFETSIGLIYRGQAHFAFQIHMTFLRGDTFRTDFPQSQTVQTSIHGWYNLWCRLEAIFSISRTPRTLVKASYNKSIPYGPTFVGSTQPTRVRHRQPHHRNKSIRPQGNIKTEALQQYCSSLISQSLRTTIPNPPLIKINLLLPQYLT